MLINDNAGRDSVAFFYSCVLHTVSEQLFLVQVSLSLSLFLSPRVFDSSSDFYFASSFLFLLVLFLLSIVWLPSSYDGQPPPPTHVRVIVIIIIVIIVRVRERMIGRPTIRLSTATACDYAEWRELRLIFLTLFMLCHDSRKRIRRARLQFEESWGPMNSQTSLLEYSYQEIQECKSLRGDIDADIWHL